MGVGKTAVSQQLKSDLPNSVFLDGDWCWDANPFQVTNETKAMVTDNICYLLNNFLHCSAYENVIFCWVMHQQSIIDSILEKLDTQNCEVKCISLIADEASLQKRLTTDVERGIRAEDVIEMMYAGATAVQVGAANLKNPYACKEIIEDLPKAMEKYGIKDLNDIIGKA